MIDPAVFRSCIDTLFQVTSPEGDVPLRLVEVAEDSGPDGFRQFSLFFHGPPQPILPQGTYEFRHQKLNSDHWFMVPIAGTSRERIVYQVCLSLLAS
jgi:hypothetical protein